MVLLGNYVVGDFDSRVAADKQLRASCFPQAQIELCNPGPIC